MSGASASSSPQDGVRLASVLSNAFIESVKSLRRDANRELMIDFEFFIMSMGGEHVGEVEVCNW